MLSANRKTKRIKREVIPIVRKMFPKRTPSPDVVVSWKKRWPRLFPVLWRAHRAFFCRREHILVKSDLYQPGILELEPGQMMLWKVDKNTEFYLLNGHRWHTLAMEIVQ